MANAFLKPEVIVAGALGLLAREVVLPPLVWRDAVADFAGAKDDTVSIRVPAYTVARKRTLRAGTPITTDEALAETKVDITLSSDIYKSVGISDENLALDISNFGTQVLTPVVSAVARKIEEELVAAIAAATYQHTLELDLTDPYNTVVDARKKLNDSMVPMSGRAIICGSTVESYFLKSDQFVKVSDSGSDSALRDAQIGRIAGFQVYTIPALDPEEAYAFHRTAYALATRAPRVPEGATWGATQSYAGLSMRVLRDYDYSYVRDRLLADLFMGTAAVCDYGAIGADGKFTPDDTPDLVNDTPLFVRAVQITVGS